MSALAIPCQNPAPESEPVQPFAHLFSPHQGKLTTAYLLNCANNYFRAGRFVDWANTENRELVTALLDSHTLDVTSFKALWKEFQRAFLKRHDLPTFGIIERHLSSGRRMGQLHAHLVLAFPAGSYTAAAREMLGAELRRCWLEIHQRFLGSAPTGKMNLVAAGPNFLRYMLKPFNRGPAPAKFGRGRNETYHMTANLPPGLWQTNQLPSRTMSPKKAIEWLAAVFAEDFTAKKLRLVFRRHWPFRPVERNDRDA
jgi:hypothetical protein